MKIAHKLGLLVSITVLGMLVLGTGAIWQLKRFQVLLDDSETTIASIQLLADARANFLDYNGRVLLHVINTDHSRLQAIEAEMKEQRSLTEASLQSYEALVADPEDKRLLDDERQKLQRVWSFYGNILDLSRQQRTEEARVLYERNLPAINEAVAALDKHAKYNNTYVEQNRVGSAAIQGQSLGITIALTALGALLVGIIGFTLYRQVNRGLGGARQLMQDIAGNLDFTRRAQVQGKDEIAEMLTAFNQLIDSLRGSLSRIMDGARQINEASEAVAGAAHKVAHGSDVQSESAAAMAAALEEITVSINHVGDRAQEADQLVRSAGASAGGGRKVIDSTVGSIHAISSAVGEASGNMAQLDERSREIASVVSVIRDVADQTNLLALNAAIEAARAGEMGRGFAVVADEVRKLAERTALSTQEIEASVSAIQSVSGSAVSRMQAAVERVDGGVAEAGRASEVMGDIVSSATQSCELVGEITLAIREQGAATNGIAHQVEAVASMATDNAVAAGEASGQAQRLRELASSMQQTVSAYKL